MAPKKHDVIKCYYSRSSPFLSILCFPNSLEPSLDRSLPKSRSRDSIALQYWPVNANRNALIGSSVKLSSLHTCRFSGAFSRDLEVDAVGIVLSTVGFVGTVKSDDLVTKYVGALNQGRWNGDCPRVVVCDEGVGSPSTVFESVLIVVKLWTRNKTYPGAGLPLIRPA